MRTSRPSTSTDSDAVDLDTFGMWPLLLAGGRPGSGSTARLGSPRRRRIARIDQLRGRRAWSVLTTGRSSDELVGERERARGGPRRDPELGEDVLEVTGDGVLAEVQVRRDVAVAPARGDEAQHLELARGEPVRVAGRRLGSRQGLDPRS